MEPLPWSGNQLKRLSRQIRAGSPVSEPTPSYGEVMLWYNDLAESVQSRIAALDWTALLGGRAFEITSRPKTLDTLRQKLQRDPGTPLPSVQDVAGVRFEAEMTLDEQDAVVNAIAGHFDHELPQCVHDLRSDPHSGYRAVHLWLRLEARVEVQVRTHLQGDWANMYEVAADVFGRHIRYDSLPESDVEREIVQSLRAISTIRVAQIEKDRNEVATLQLSLDELPSGVKTRAHYRTARRRVEVLQDRTRSNERKLRQDLDRLRQVFRDQRLNPEGS